MKEKTLFDYENSDEPMQDPETKLKVEFFNCILDAILQSLEKRSLQLQQHNIHFKFIYNISSLRNMSKEHLMKHCVHLQALLTDKQTGEADIDGLQMMEELDALSVLIKSDAPPLEVLRFITKYDFAPNVAVALRILLTLPMSVASGERSLFLLKFTKKELPEALYVTRTISELVTIAVENRTTMKLKFEAILSEFASMKARKVNSL
jgi:hypothetical protein